MLYLDQEILKALPQTITRLFFTRSYKPGVNLSLGSLGEASDNSVCLPLADVFVEKNQ